MSLSEFGSNFKLYDEVQIRPKEDDGVGFKLPLSSAKTLKAAAMELQTTPQELKRSILSGEPVPGYQPVLFGATQWRLFPEGAKNQQKESDK